MEKEFTMNQDRLYSFEGYGDDQEDDYDDLYPFKNGNDNITLNMLTLLALSLLVSVI